MNVTSMSFGSANVDVDDIKMKILLDYIFSRGIYEATYTPHEHPVHELYYISEGWMYFECDDKIEKLEKGDIFIIKAHSLHRVIRCGNGVSRFHLRFQFTNDPDKSNFPIESKHISPSPKVREEIMNLIEKIQAVDVENITKLDFFRLRANLGILFSYVLEYMDEKADTGSNAFNNIEQSNRLITFALIDDFFADNYATCQSIDKLSRMLKYSKIQTQRIILDYYGMTFSQKLRDTRIRYAKKFLSETDMTIDEIAAKCGYSTRQGFEAAFTKCASITPNKYRQTEAKCE